MVDLIGLCSVLKYFPFMDSILVDGPVPVFGPGSYREKGFIKLTKCRIIVQI